MDKKLGDALIENMQSYVLRSNWQQHWRRIAVSACRAFVDKFELENEEKSFVHVSDKPLFTVDAISTEEYAAETRRFLAPVNLMDPEVIAQHAVWWINDRIRERVNGLKTKHGIVMVGLYVIPIPEGPTEKSTGWAGRYRLVSCFDEG